MMLDQINAVVSSNPLLDTAWTILEAANDMGDGATVKVCRRVIDALLVGTALAKSDINVVFAFLGSAARQRQSGKRVGTCWSLIG